MKKQRVSVLSLFLAVLWVTVLPGKLFPVDAGGSIYGHISFVEGETTVIREDKTEHQAVVNLPIAPGDQIFTGEKGRCELQFDNGTIIRLDKDTRLNVTTVLAPSLTSRWKITTLHLMRGQVCSMNQSYDQEMFQVITPNAALDLKRRSTAYIRLQENGDTFVFAERGKFNAMYGESIQYVKTETLRSGSGYLLTADHQMRINEGKRDLDFVAWNEYVNRNFMDLHYGISKVPRKIYRYTKGLVYWAEKWSSLYGEWVYDELFGYIWKPADEIFAMSHRPFFFANYVRINGKLFVVPQQPWGWMPAHMGTWVWMKKGGWHWIPGSAFSAGVSWGNCFPTLGYWVDRCYGSSDLYYIYRNHGVGAWRRAYTDIYGTTVKHPRLNFAPEEIRNIFKKMNHMPVMTLIERLGKQFPSTAIEREKLAPIFKSLKPSIGGNPDKQPAAPIKVKAALTGNQVNPSITTISPVGRDNEPGNGIKNLKEAPGNSSRVIGFRDWNPDMRWANREGIPVVYSSKTNTVICPHLGLSSNTITAGQRASLRDATSIHGGYRGINSGSGYSSGSTGSTGVSAVSVTNSGGPQNPGGQGSGADHKQ